MHSVGLNDSQEVVQKGPEGLFWGVGLPHLPWQTSSKSSLPKTDNTKPWQQERDKELINAGEETQI